ncbi:MAG: hypothetical protein LC107_08200 [Chitinophagales bacterium]|nr:hypothetical protein [Chitinophagales bacterium]
MAVLLGITDSKDITLVQAILLLKSKGIVIDNVKYIRTGGLEIDRKAEMFYNNFKINFVVSSLPQGGKLQKEDDYLVQEDELFKWYLESTHGFDKIYVFIGGGHKLHSLALQKCAFLFGAEEVFHMFIDVPREHEPKSISDIEIAIKNNQILYANIGKHLAWPAIKKLVQQNITAPNLIREVIGIIGSRAVSQVNELPFESLQLLPAMAMQWLQGRLVERDYDFIKMLPKVELHCHLGGFASDGDALDIVRASYEGNIPLREKHVISYPENWPLPKKPIELDKYMNLGDNTGSYILHNKGCLEKQIELLYSHFLEQNIGYAEVRCSPYNYASDKYSGFEIVQIIIDKFNELMDLAKEHEFWCHVNLLIIATRTDLKNTQKIQNHLELATVAESKSSTKGLCKIVGVDLAGFEHPSTRASYYTNLFDPIHRKGIALTIHAGENDESEAIWDAVFRLNTRRIGHGLHLYQDANLLKSVINRGIGVEMCPYANYQIKGYAPMENQSKVYPLLDYLNQGAQVTVNTDNIGISSASLTDNIILLSKLNPDITRIQILQLVRNGINQAFIDVSLRNKFIEIYNERIFKLILEFTL